MFATLFTYTLAPILTRQLTGPSAPNMKPIIDQEAQGLKNQAIDIASPSTNHAANTAQDLSSRVIDMASSSTDHVAEKTPDFKDRVIDTASSAIGHTMAAAQVPKGRAIDTAAATTGRAVGMSHGLKTRTIDTAYSTTDRMGTGAQYADNYETAAPNASGFDQNGLSKDRRTQLHPLESGSVNTAL